MRIRQILLITLAVILYAPLLAMAQSVVSVTPADDLKALVESGGTDVTYQLSPGIYRTGEIVPPDGTTIEGQAGVEINGSEVVTNWQRVGTSQVWTSNGHTTYAASSIVCRSGEVRCGARQMVMVDDVLYPEADSLESLSTGHVFLDYGSGVLYLVDDPTGKVVELSEKTHFVSGVADDVTLKALVVTKFGVPAGKAAIHQGNFDGTPNTTEGWLIEDVEVAWNRGIGVRIQKDGIVRNSWVHHNSQYGMSGADANIRVEGTVIEANAWGGVHLGDSGAMKYTHTLNMVFTDNIVRENHGVGVWLDINNRDAEILSNYVVGNEGPGIFYEISYRADIHHNVVESNGQHPDWSAWVNGAGILVANSPDVMVHHNAVIGNGDGIAGIMVERGSGIEGLYDLANLSVHENVLVMTDGEMGVVTNHTIANPTDYYTIKGNSFTNNLLYSLKGPSVYRWNEQIGDASIWPHAGTERIVGVMQ